MEIPIISAAVGALLSSSLPKLYEAVGNLRHAEVKPLEQELRHIKGAIEESHTNWKGMSKQQKADLDGLRLLAYDIEDCIDSKDMIGRLHLKATIQEINRRVENMRAHLKSFQAEESKSKLHAGTSRSSTSSSAPASAEEAGTSRSSTSSSAPASAEEACPDASQDQHLQLPGMKERVEDVLDLVRGPKNTSWEKKLKVISIVGFDGIGKSLLACQVYKGVKDEYPLHDFVQAGEKDEQQVLIRLNKIREKYLLGTKELLKSEDKRSKSDYGHPADKGKAVVDSDGPDVASTSSQPHRSTEEKKHRIFVVIDDLREEQLGKRIMSVFTVTEEHDGKIVTGTMAGAVLLTTSVLSVAKGCKSNHVYKMKPLNDKDSEELFLDVAGIKKEIAEPDKESIEEVKMKCDGLPLALVSVANFCRTDVGRWKKAWETLSSAKEDCDLERMQRVLADIYTNLSSHPLQASLLYFCMFPHGHPVRKGSMIRRWLAEGPEVDCRTGADGQPKDHMSSAKGCFQTLVDRNVIWPHQESTNNIEDVVKTWKPPAVMLEYITGLSGRHKFILLSSPKDDKPQDIRRLSLHHTSNSDGEMVLKKNLSRLRTLAIFRETEGEANLSFTSCKMLRLLDLEACKGVKDRHVDEICEELRLLKYLSLGTSITQVPRDIEHLQRLETLDVGKQTVVKVPAEVIMLPELRHLLGKVELLTNYGPIRSDTKSSELKRKLQESRLQTLAGFVVTKSQGFPQLMRRMKSLNKVKIWCGPRVSSRNVEDVSASIREFLARAVTMDQVKVPFSLSIDFQQSDVPILDKLAARGAPPRERRWWRDFGKRTSSHHGSSSSEHNDQASGGPSENNRTLGCLTSLKLKGFSRLSTVPAFLSNLKFIHVLCVSSRVVTWKDIIESVSNLSTLQYLKLVEVDGEDAQQDNSVVVMQKKKLARLERMCLVAKRKLPSFEIEDGALQTLKSLHLMCQQHLVACFEINFLTELEEVALHYTVQTETKKAWKQVAKEHPNTPQVLLIQSCDHCSWNRNK